MPNSTKTLCPYCGVGCGLDVTANPSGLKVGGDRSHPSSLGMVCVKGATVAECLEKDRLLYPLYRQNLSDQFQQISWEKAFNLIVEQIKKVQLEKGSDGICMYGSGQLQTEDYYVAQKLLKGCLGTNNFDTNSRLCMSSAVSAYKLSLGSDGPPCCYEDLDITDCAFIIGSNTAECHPIIFNRLHKQLKNNHNAKLIVVDPRRTKTAEVADLHLAIQPGSDITLLNGIAYLLFEWGFFDKVFIDKHTQNFAEYVEVIKTYLPEKVTEICGISLEDLETTARYWAESKSVLSLWSMGLNQSSEGTAKICSLINLHLMTGQISKPGTGPFSLTGQPNAMGGREAGGLSNLLPGYRDLTNPKHRAEVENFWNIPPHSIAPQPGRHAWEMIIGLEEDEVGLFWIAATNPAVSLPDLERVKKALLRSPFTVYQDAYYPTETSAYAHLLLPACQWSEKTGTMTNSERRVTLSPQFREAGGEAKPDWEIFAEVGRRLGFEQQFLFENAAEVFQEFVQLTRDRLCEMTGINHQRLQTEGPLQWPALLEEGWTEESEDLSKNVSQTAKRLYLDARFPTPDGRARFKPFYSQGLAEPPDADYPFVLTTGRLYGHWHTQTRTGRIAKIVKMHPHPFIEIHPQDAEQLGITDGTVLEVRSRRGLAQFPAKVTTAIKRGTLFVPMHWGSLWADQAEANTLTHPQACPISHEPELKACAVQLKIKDT
ncbi:MAG: molybdopterin oxidoreductase family protein [Microcystaceae cyanobacterium]